MEKYGTEDFTNFEKILARNMRSNPNEFCRITQFNSKMTTT